MSPQDNPVSPWKAANPFVMTRHFVMSAFCIATLVAFFLLWSWIATVLTGGRDFDFGRPFDIAISLHGGGIALALALIGALWLSGYLSRRHLVRKLSRRIEELESELSHRDKADGIDPLS